MADETLLAQLQRDFAKVPFMRHHGIVIEEIGEDFAKLRLPSKKDLLRSPGVIHGGALASLVDVSVAVAVISTFPGGVNAMTAQGAAATVEMKINFLAPALGNDFWCQARIVKRGSRIAVGDAEVTNGDGTLIAKALVTYLLPKQG